MRHENHRWRRNSGAHGIEAGSDWITVSAAAHVATIGACKKVADEFNVEIQIEIYGNWTMDDAQSWVD